MCRYVHNLCISAYPQMYPLGFSNKTRMRHGSQFFLNVQLKHMILTFQLFFVELLMSKKQLRALRSSNVCPFLQGGPLQVINRVITPINGLING